MTTATQNKLDWNKLLFRLYGIARLTSSDCTFNQAQALSDQERVTAKQFARYRRIWNNSAFHFCSPSQDRLYAAGGWAALERRFDRALKLRDAWRLRELAPFMKLGA